MMATSIICLCLIIFALLFPSEGTMEENSFLSLVDDEAYVDKSGFIKLFHGHSDPVFFTAPQQFGKTVNLNMLKIFYEINVDEDGEVVKKEQTGNFKAFKTLKNKEKVSPTIMEDDKFFKAHFGAYPVIHISFKPLDVANYQAFIDSLFELVQEMFSSSPYYPCFESDHHKSIFGEYKSYLDDLLASKKPNKKVTAINGLKTLSAILNKIFKTKTIVLIDDVDAPVRKVISQRSTESDKIFDTIKEFLSVGLKDNECVLKSFVTGQSFLAGVYLFGVTKMQHFAFTINAEFSKFFGLNELEVKHLVQLDPEYQNKTKLEQKLDKIHSYYNGYKIADTQTRIYNPFSVGMYLQTAVLRPYWSVTGKPGFMDSFFSQKFMRDFLESCVKGDDFIILSYGDAGVLGYGDVTALRKIFQYDPTRTKLDNKEIGYLKSFLYELGYFTIREKVVDCLRVGIPNQEVRIILEKFMEKSTDD